MNKPGVSKFTFPRSKEEMPTGAYARGGVIVDTNAGWRTFRPQLDAARCTRCQRCWLICPEGAVDRTTAAYTIDYDFCKGCGLCAYECPVKAIAMVKEADRE